jgi:gamma-glutamyltranspeptidase/glutathione hydrolase
MAIGYNGCVSTPHHLASSAALDTLRSGGNAVDAAVVAATVSGVVQPFSSGVGGGGWATVYRAGTRTVDVLEFHGRVPLGTNASMFEPDDAGLVDGQELEARGGALLASLVPGAPAGWEELLRRHGTLSFADALAPAIALAEQGFPVSELLHRTIAENAARLRHWPGSRAAFLPGDAVPRVGALLAQPDLATTLRAIALRGAAEAYTGDLARRVTRFYAECGGTVSMADLADYRPRWADPVRGSFRGHAVVGAPAPLGDLAFVQGLHIMDVLPRRAGPTDPEYIHASVESAKLVRADRTRYLGEGAESLSRLLDPSYIEQAARSIGVHATAGVAETQGPGHTITLAVADGNGDAVHLMQTVGAPFGTGAVAANTGIVTNSSLLFAHVDPGRPNSVAPGRRLEQNPVVTMIFGTDGRLRLIAGSPGGKTRVETVRQMVINVLDFGMNVQQAVDAPRFLSAPDGVTVLLEEALHQASPELCSTLAAKGHRVHVTPDLFGTGQAIEIDPTTGALMGAADWRQESTALAY